MHEVYQERGIKARTDQNKRAAGHVLNHNVASARKQRENGEKNGVKQLQNGEMESGYPRTIGRERVRPPFGIVEEEREEMLVKMSGVVAAHPGSLGG